MLSSLVAWAPEPHTSAYVVSKWAVQALAECLRMELVLTGNGHIHVCTVVPATTDTNIFTHAANYSGRAVHPIPPVHTPERAAEAIVRLSFYPKRMLRIGLAGHLFAIPHLLAPALYEPIAAPVIEHLMYQKGVRAPNTPGNLFTPMPHTTTTRGGWLKENRRLLPLVLGAATLLGAAGLALGRRGLSGAR